MLISNLILELNDMYFPKLWMTYLKLMALKTLSPTTTRQAGSFMKTKLDLFLTFK